MADIAITEGDVVKGTGAKTLNGTFGAVIAAGQTVYKDASDNKYKLFDSDAAGTSVLAGISLNSGADGQPCQIFTEGDLTVSSVVTVGTVYMASNTPGGIGPVADLISGDEVNVVGVGISATQIKVKIIASGVDVP